MMVSSSCIGHPGGTSDVVLQHPEPPVGTADDVDTGSVNATAVAKVYLEGRPGDGDRGWSPAVGSRTSQSPVHISIHAWLLERIHPLDDPADRVAQSSGAITLGTRSSGNGRSSPDS